MTIIADRKKLDRRGKTITTYIIYDAAAMLRDMRVGEVLELVTDNFDPIPSDVAAWCRATGMKLIGIHTGDTELSFFIEKREPRSVDRRMAFVISTDRLEELLSPLGFALAAALEGIEVHLFFQGPGVHVLAEGHRPKLKGLARPFSRFAAASMAKSGHILPRDKLAQLHALGAHLYACAPSMERFKVRREDLIYGDISLVEYLTFVAVMAEADIQLYS